MKTYKFRLYPTIDQTQKLLWNLEQCRLVYNFALEKLHKQHKPDRYELQKSLTRLKEQFPELKDVYSKVLQYEIYRLFFNLKSLKKLKKNGKKVGKLRFKSRDSFKTIHYNQSGFKIISTSLRYDKLHLSKIGDILFRKHREINGKIKQVVIKKYPSNKWYIFIIADQEKKTIKKQIKDAVGIDVGIKYFLSDSAGRQAG